MENKATQAQGAAVSASIEHDLNILREVWVKLVPEYHLTKVEEAELRTRLVSESVSTIVEALRRVVLGYIRRDTQKDLAERVRDAFSKLGGTIYTMQNPDPVRHAVNKMRIIFNAKFGERFDKKRLNEVFATLFRKFSFDEIKQSITAASTITEWLEEFGLGHDEQLLSDSPDSKVKLAECNDYDEYSRVREHYWIERGRELGDPLAIAQAAEIRLAVRAAFQEFYQRKLYSEGASDPDSPLSYRQIDALTGRLIYTQTKLREAGLDPSLVINLVRFIGRQFLLRGFCINEAEAILAAYEAILCGSQVECEWSDARIISNVLIGQLFFYSDLAEQRNQVDS